MRKFLCLIGIHLRMSTQGQGGFGYYIKPKAFFQYYKCCDCGKVKGRYITRKA